MAPALSPAADTRLLLQALHLRGPRKGPRTPRPRTLGYFFRLFICGGPEMAPALPPAADTRLLLQALHLRGPRNGPRTPPGRGHSVTSSPCTSPGRGQPCASASRRRESPGRVG